MNLAWKLALVERGDADPALLDSYDAERVRSPRWSPSSGDAFDQMQLVTSRSSATVATRRCATDLTRWPAATTRSSPPPRWTCPTSGRRSSSGTPRGRGVARRPTAARPARARPPHRSHGVAREQRHGRRRPPETLAAAAARPTTTRRCSRRPSPFQTSRRRIGRPARRRRDDHAPGRASGRVRRPARRRRPRRRPAALPAPRRRLVTRRDDERMNQVPATALQLRSVINADGTLHLSLQTVDVPDAG